MSDVPEDDPPIEATSVPRADSEEITDADPATPAVHETSSGGVRTMLDTRTLVQALIDPRPPYGPLLGHHHGLEIIVTSRVLDEAVRILFGESVIRERLDALSTIAPREILDVALPRVVQPEITAVEVEASEDPWVNLLLAEALATEVVYLVTPEEELLELEASEDWQDFKQENGILLQIIHPDEVSSARTLGSD